MWHQQFVTHAHKHTCWSPLAVIDMKGPSVTGLSIKCGFQCSILWSKSHAPPRCSTWSRCLLPQTLCVFQLSPRVRPIFILSAAHFFMIGFQYEIKIDLIYFDTFLILLCTIHQFALFQRRKNYFFIIFHQNVITYSDIPFQLMSPRLCRPEFDHIIPNHFHEISWGFYNFMSEISICTIIFMFLFCSYPTEC